MDQERVNLQQAGEEYKNKSPNPSSRQQRYQAKDEEKKTIKKKFIPPFDSKDSWPIFKTNQKTFKDNKFWNKSKQIIGNSQDYVIIFQGNLIKMNTEKKTSKTHHYKLTSEGILFYFLRETDENAKGYLQVSAHIFVHLTQQTTNKQKKFDGINLTLFQSSNEIILDFFENLKLFAIITGFNRLYQKMELLGKGSFASVFKVRSHMKKEQCFAAKVYFKETFDSNQNKEKFLVMIKNEIQALRQCIHVGIIYLHEVIQDTDKLILIIELVSGGDLYELVRQVKQINERQGAQLLKNICEALEAMHNRGYVHRDLKLENIMLCKKDLWDIKLVDFGFTEPININELISKAGTPGYIPPEIFKLQPYTPKGDVFSLGIIFYAVTKFNIDFNQLYSGFSAFKGKNYSQVLLENRRCDIRFDHMVWAEYSTDCKAILKKMLAKKPENRITLKQILQSSWIIYHNLKEEQPKLASYNAPIMLQKQLTRHSQINQSDDDEQYSLDFPFQNNLKSFYMRLNSQKKFKSFKNISTNQNQQQLQRQQSVKVIRSSQVEEEQQNEQQDQHIKSRAKETRSSMEEIFEDQSISVRNINFLKRAQRVFNQKKLPSFK